MKTKTRTPITAYQLVLLLLAPTVLLAFTLRSTIAQFQDDIQVSELELRGLHETQMLYRQLRLVQRIRGTRTLLIAGNPHMAEKLAEARRDFRQISEKLLADKDTRLLEVDAPIRKIVETLSEIDARPYTEDDTMVLFETYTEQISHLQETIRLVWDKGAFSVDPDLETSHLSLILSLRLPALSETLGRIRNLSAYSRINAYQHTRMASELEYAVRLSHNELRRLRWEIQILKKDAKTSPSVIGKLERTANEIEAFGAKAIKIDTYGQQVAANTYEAGSQIVALLHDAASASSSHLEDAIEHRLASQKRKLYLTVASTTLALLISLMATIGFFRRNQQAFAELMRSRDKLANSEALQRAILDNTVDGIITFDAANIITSVNQSAEHIFGHVASEVVGQDIQVLMPEPYRSPHDDAPHSPVMTGKARIVGIGREVTGLRKNGETFPLDLSVSEISHQGQRMFVGVVRDISERKRIEKMKSEFVSTVSHELRTPLTSITGALALASSGTLGELPEQAKPMLEIALKNSRRLASLINDLLDMEKIAAGKLDFEFQVQPLQPLLEQAIELNKAFGDQFAVGFVQVASAGDTQVHVDGQRLIQVLSNLLSNAAKFSEQGGSVEIATRCSEDRVRVSVTDHGSGIPNAFRDRIFQKFTQADSSDTRKKGGTGLGLAISKELIERMGGEIGLESEEGHGATFYFELPVAR